MSEFRITEITSFPRPRPEDAPFTSPGTSRNWIVAPLCSSTPGTTVRVVKSYAPTSDFASVSLFRSVDFPTDGKPTRVTVPSPDFLTEYPSPPLFAEAFFSRIVECNIYTYRMILFTGLEMVRVFQFIYIS